MYIGYPLKLTTRLLPTPKNLTSRSPGREREFISQMNKQIKQIQISTVAGYQ